MDFALTDEQELLLESLQEWLDRNVSEKDVQKWYYDDHAIPDEIWKSFYDAGFALLGVPEEFGGTPCDFQTSMLVQETISRHFCANALMVKSLAFYDIIEFGNDEQLKWCTDSMAATGKMPFVMALSEPEAGSNSANIQATVKEVDGKLILNGHKTWVSNGLTAKWFMVTAKDDDPNSDKSSIWFVPADAEGVSTEPIEEIGFNLMPFCEVYFNDVEIDPKNLLGKRGDGFIQIMKNFQMERAIVSASMLGMAEGAQDDAGAYVSQRIAFGKPISQFQLVQEMLTDNEIGITNMRNMVREMAWKIDNGYDTRIETSLAKRYCSKEGTEIGDRCIEIMGGLGYTRETRVSRCWLDNRGYQIGGGTREIMVHIAGRLLARRYAAK